MKTAKDFKYTTRISAEILGSNISEKKPEILESQANKLAGMSPYLNPLQHQDLFGTAFEIALVNQFNENGDGVSTKDALGMIEGFAMKQMNIEHDRTMIVGHVLDACFSERSFGKKLYYEDVVNSNEIFSIVLSGVIYKLANVEFSEMLSEAVGGSSMNKIYASWEVGFNDYKIGIGSRKLSECEIIEDPEKIEYYSSMLKTNGGSGQTTDGRYVQRLITGEIVPLGGGFTLNPAAKVQEIFVYDPANEERHEEYDEPEEDSNAKYLEKNSATISQKEMNNVITSDALVDSAINCASNNKQFQNKGDEMDETQVKKLVEEALASREKETQDMEEAVASVTSKLIDAIKQNNEEYVAEKEAVAKEKDEAEAKVQEQAKEIEQLKEGVSSLEEKLSVASDELKTLKEEQEQAEAQAKFDSRMDEIKEEYELDEKLCEVIAKRISAVETDEQYAELKEEFSLTFAHLNKETLKASKEAEKVEKVEEVEDPIEKGGEEASAAVSNNASASCEEEETLQDKFSKALNKESVKIN